MTEVLKPTIVRLGSYCYRLNPGDIREQQDAHPDCQHDVEDYYQANDDTDIDSRVKEHSTGGSGAFTASIDVPSALFKFVIGKKGETKRTLEYETKCSILIPSRGTEGPIVIKGRTGRGVTSAITRIEVLVESGREKTTFTHFISIPINQPLIQEGFQEFQEDVMENFSNCRGVNNSLFQMPCKLHMTLGTMTLLNESEVTQASQALHECKSLLSQILGSNCKLRVHGLDYMNDDPTNVDVLYAKVRSADGSNKLQKAADLLFARLTEAGMLNNDFERDGVKLHVTLMNSVFRRDKKASKGHQTFDAQPILKLMTNFDFGEIDLPGFHLSKRYSTSCDGYYEAVTSILTDGRV